MTEPISLSIAETFNGPPESANGGYTCGLLAAYIDGPVEVTLRKPPPLDREMQVLKQPDASVELRDAEELVASARPVEVSVDVPALISSTEVASAAKGYAGFHYHAFPSCFVCGPKREPGTGLEIYTGPVTDSELVAAPWVPSENFDDGRGYVREEIVWAALDCPGYFSFRLEPGQPAVLGRMSAKLLSPVPVGKTLSAIAWPISTEGRKLHCGSALYSEEGKVHALAKATWILLDKNVIK